MPTLELTTSQRRLVALAAALATEPQVLLVDEVAAGAGAEELDAVAQAIDRGPRARRSGARRRAQRAARAPRRRPRARARQPGRSSPRDRSPRWPRAASCNRRTWERRDCRLTAVRRLAFLLAGLALLAAGCGKGSSHSAAGRHRDRGRRAGHRQPVHRADDPPGRRARDLEPERRRRPSDRLEELPAQGEALRQPPLRARTAVEDTRRALDAGAVTIVTDGTGVDATWQLAKQRRRLDRHHARRRHRPRRRGGPAERLPHRADESRDRLPLRRVPDPEEAEGRAALRRQRLRARGRRRHRARVLGATRSRSR